MTINAVLYPVSESPQVTVRRLVDLATRGLIPMFDEQSGLFCYKLNGASEGLVREGVSQRYTIMSLLGLDRLQRSGGTSPFEFAPLLGALLNDTAWVNNIGDLGLLVWLCAHVAPERLDEIDERLHITTALQVYADAKYAMTMETAWLLTGLCYWAQACPEKKSELTNLAVQAYTRLIENQGKSGIFGHASKTGSLAGRTRGWIGSFADQVYPIYALSLFYKVFGERAAEARALECGLLICQAQGEKGQWWWHYDSSTGRVIEGYPVFSVHQHAMAPMALFLLSDVTGRDFTPWIFRGLEWVNGRNELQFDMESDAARVIWRCIFRSKSQFKRYLNAALERTDKKSIESSGGLEVLFECRPYELGWLLYAFAGRM